MSTHHPMGKKKNHFGQKCWQLFGDMPRATRCVLVSAETTNQHSTFPTKLFGHLPRSCAKLGQNSMFRCNFSDWIFFCCLCGTERMILGDDCLLYRKPVHGKISDTISCSKWCSKWKSSLHFHCSLLQKSTEERLVQGKIFWGWQFAKSCKRGSLYNEIISCH